MKRAFGVLAALLLIGGVAFALLRPVGGDDKPETIKVTGLIGSEKREFFADPAVIAELRQQGLEVTVESTGSWLMGSTDLKKYDFAFPASSSPAEGIKKSNGVTGEQVRPFYSPLVMVAHRQVAEVLKKNGLAEVSKSDVWTFKMDAYVQAVREKRTWEQLTGSAGHRELSGRLFVTTTDPDDSSSGALYLALVSYLANGRQVVSDDAGVQRVKDLVKGVVEVQGGQRSSSEGPFTDFVSGVGSPLVLAYESQVASLTAKGGVAKGGSAGDMVMLYPDVTVSSDHTVVARTDGGRKLAELLRDNKTLRALEAKYGFRPQADPVALEQVVAGKEGPVFARDLSAAQVVQAQVPTVEMLGKLVNTAKGR
ncbi:hypothetical protein ACWEQL_31445 [Kitasatospora sp. NPDC004240]